MLKTLKNNTAQIIFGEYVLVLFLIVAAATGMTVYFKRAIQARIHDATVLTAQTVTTTVPRNYYVGNVYAQYEPYYLNTASGIEQTSFAQEKLLGSFNRTTGIFRKTTNDGTAVKTDSDTAAPRFGAGR